MGCREITFLFLLNNEQGLKNTSEIESDTAKISDKFAEGMWEGMGAVGAELGRDIGESLNTLFQGEGMLNKWGRELGKGMLGLFNEDKNPKRNPTKKP